MKTDNRQMGYIRSIYITAYCLVALIFLKAVWYFVSNSVFEQDLLWFVPTVLREVKALPPGRLLLYLLRPWPAWFEVASLKIYVFSALSLFGPMAKYLIYTSILVHFMNSALLYKLGRQFGFSYRAAFLACVMYLSYFAHFHAYMWPMAFQHLLVIFFILLGLNLYCKVETIASGSGDYRRWFIAAFAVNCLASLCRISILALPLVMFTDILISSKSDKDRVIRFDRWLPVFMIYLAYALFTAVVGDTRVQALMRPFSFLSGIYCWSAAVKYAVVLSLCLLVLFGLRKLLWLYQQKYVKIMFRRLFIAAAVFCFIALFIGGGAKRLLMPYNIFAPFVGGLASFLDPLNNALSMNSTRPYFFIPLQITVFYIFFSVVIIAIFTKNIALKNKRSLMLAGLYLANIVYLYLRNPMPSRYFIYITPVISLLFCGAYHFVFNFITARVKNRIVAKEIIAVVCFIGLCIPNIIAVKAAIFAGRLANGFDTYDYVRASSIINERMTAQKEAGMFNNRGVVIKNIKPVVFSPQKDFTADDPHNDNARFVASAILKIRPYDVLINDETGALISPPVFTIANGYTIKDERGYDADKFSSLYETAMEQLSGGRYGAAETTLLEAVSIEPFLLRHILCGLPLEDLPWLTRGKDARDWVNDISARYAVTGSREESGRNKYITAIMDREIEEYVKCLFFLAFLKDKDGDPGQARFWFSQIRFLENDYRDVRLILSHDPSFSSAGAPRLFFDRLNNTVLFVPEENYSDRYKFERFLFRLMTRI